MHSKAFVIRWVTDGHVGALISYSFIPQKKSINFGVYCFQGTSKPTVDLSSDSTDLDEALSHAHGALTISALERYHAGESHSGQFEIPENHMVAFVFDNTFSKNTAKTVAFSFSLDKPAPQFTQSKPAHDSSAPVISSDGRYLTGSLLKRRRKRMQGFGRRHFSLDTKRALLNYYLDGKSSSLRGVMPLKICDIDVSTKPMIILDSGVEKWILKAITEYDWQLWVQALEDVQNVQYGSRLSREPSVMGRLSMDGITSSRATPPADATDWFEIARAVDSAVNATDEYSNKTGEQSSEASEFLSKLADSLDKIDVVLRRHIPSTSRHASHTRSGSNGSYAIAGAAGGPVAAVEPPLNQVEEEDEDDIFYDADGGEEDDLSSSDSEAEQENGEDYVHVAKEYQDAEEAGLFPLPEDHVERRTQVPKCEHAPPSLISMIRKSAGKDLSSITAPVTSNEPLSLLQKLAETYEYSYLLDKAASTHNEHKRLLLVATFAMSQLAAMRFKARALRKPFNPLLGETYELVREDKGFRYLAEKVSHRPPILATYAESANWTVSFTSRPHQKIWGKSAEITDTGSVVITLLHHKETYEYQNPTCFLRNLIAGEKYIEPEGVVHVECSNGGSAAIEFKAGGMWSGRSEEVKIVDRTHSGSTLEGKWTEGLRIASGDNKDELIWKVGELVKSPKDHYGWPEFTASLNEITRIEEGSLPPTDSRLRPDQRAYENQDVDTAEELKLALEQRQRERRAEYEAQGKTWEPVFFQKAHDELGAFTPRHGKQNYWHKRKYKQWDGVTDIMSSSG